MNSANDSDEEMPLAMEARQDEETTDRIRALEVVSALASRVGRRRSAGQCQKSASPIRESRASRCLYRRARSIAHCDILHILHIQPRQGNDYASNRQARAVDPGQPHRSDEGDYHEGAEAERGSTQRERGWHQVARQREHLSG